MSARTKGEGTIPQAIRERQIAKAKGSKRPTRGQALVERLRGRSSVRMSTDEILALMRK
jgi:hypothetical protein